MDLGPLCTLVCHAGRSGAPVTEIERVMRAMTHLNIGALLALAAWLLGRSEGWMELLR